jgi:hypothetical protein
MGLRGNNVSRCKRCGPLDATDPQVGGIYQPRATPSFSTMALPTDRESGRAFDLFVACTNFGAMEARPLLQQRFDWVIYTGRAQFEPARLSSA